MYYIALTVRRQYNAFASHYTHTCEVYACAKWKHWDWYVTTLKLLTRRERGWGAEGKLGGEQRREREEAIRLELTLKYDFICVTTETFSELRFCSGQLRSITTCRILHVGTPH